MMMEATRAHEKLITNALEQEAASVKHVAPKSWDLSLANGRLAAASARIDDAGWFLLDAPLDHGTGAKRTALSGKRLHDYLKWNAELTGGAKFVVEPRDRSARLRVEIPLDLGERADPAGQVHLACQGCKAALEKLCDGRKERHSVSLVDLSRGRADTSRCDLLRLCRETGWGFVERSSGRISVELEVLNGSHSAILAERENGDISASVDVAVWTSLSGASRRSLDLLILSTAGFVRMVRPAVVKEGDKSRARFEMVFSSPCRPAQLAHALSALSLACRFCAQECRLLQKDETIAREYLSAMSV